MSQRTIKWVLIIIAAFLYVMQLADYINFSVDDTFISMRVARNVAYGYGFVYNIGENVEGFSNWLWVVLMAIPLKMGYFSGENAMGLLWFAKGLSIVFSIFTLMVAYRFIMTIFANDIRKEVYGLVGVLAIISSAIFSAWSMSGMETTSYGFILLASISLITSVCSNDKSVSRSSVLLALALMGLVLSRPEGIYLAFIIVGVGAFFNRKKERGPTLIRIVSAVVLCYVLFLVWRWNTYGELVPNTYYAKTGGGLRSYLFGIKYVIAGFGSINALLLFFSPFVFLQFKDHRMVVGVLVSVLFALVIFMSYSGGDWMPGFRFVVPSIPIISVLAVISIKALAERGGGMYLKYSSLIYAMVAIVVLCSIFSGRTLIRAQAPSLGSAFYSADGHLMPSHKLVAKWLKDHSDSTTLFACGEAGLIGYENQNLRMIDLNGLMDKHIALDRKENKPFDVDYVLDQRPKYVILHGSKEEERERMNYSRSTDYFGALGESPRLHNEYRLAFECRSFDVYERK